MSKYIKVYIIFAYKIQGNLVRQNYEELYIKCFRNKIQNIMNFKLQK